jgi:hypothetical protein
VAVSGFGGRFGVRWPWVLRAVGCGSWVAVLYCRADSAKLCLLCDQHIHSANLLSRKHQRLQICDNCGSEASLDVPRTIVTKSKASLDVPRLERRK